MEHAKTLEAEAAAGAGAAGVDAFAAAPVEGADVLGGRSEAEMAADRRRALQELERSAGPGAAPSPLRPTRLDVSSHAWGSRFRAFIACLPGSVADIGNCLAWGEADFARLGGAPLAHQAARFLRDIAKGYVSLFGAFAEAGAVRGLERHFTWAHWRWALACVMSRQNSMPGRRGGQHLVLAPLYDMVNHAPGPITSHFCAETAAIELAAARDFAAGEELVMSYGRRPDDQLLMFQGFVCGGSGGDGRPSDAVEAAAVVALADGPPAPDALEKLRASIAGNLRGGGPKASGAAAAAVFPVARLRDGRVVLPRAALSHCRVAALDREDAPAALRSVQVLLKAVPAGTAAAADGAVADGAGHRHGHGHGHGHSHGEGGASSCTGCAVDAAAPLLLPLLSARNEALARAFLAAALRGAIEGDAGAAAAAEAAGGPRAAVASFAEGRVGVLRDVLAALEGEREEWQ